ncbi:MAG TPA: hypothetical protein VJS64_08295 [Pyrinomonadaceae bacterium]|nr:hypothetical protein [Pyrinomonadaceae bacterium]
MRTFEPSESYRNVFYGDVSRDIMIKGRILAPGDEPRWLIDKFLARLARSEVLLRESKRDTTMLIETVRSYVDDGVCIFGSPLLTNVSANRPTLASCIAVPFEDAQLSYSELDTAEKYYKLNMGSGYNLNDHKNPVEALIALNRHASRLETALTCERYIGNIAHVSVSHPYIRDFITAKTRYKDVKHFNISVDISDSFMSALVSGSQFRLDNGEMVRASGLWDDLVHSAWLCGDPGLISLARFNAHNPVADVSPYTTTAPCAEVGLSKGEACVFAYINLAACLRWKQERLDVDYDLLGNVAECLTRVLDDSLEASLSHFPTTTSNSVMAANRKIGIGLCGFADTLIWLGIDYGSTDSCDLVRRALSTINFRSKHASMVLAARRGAFSQFPRSRYVTEPTFGARFASASVGIPPEAWYDLAREISTHGIRNAMTTALPPSGRSSLLLGTSPSIEPILDARSQIVPLAPYRALVAAGFLTVDEHGAARITRAHEYGPWPRQVASPHSLFRGARQLSVDEHLSVLSAAATLVDDGVSKTVNLPYHSGVSNVEEVFNRAWSGGLKAISVYRDPMDSQLGASKHHCGTPTS